MNAIQQVIKKHGGVILAGLGTAGLIGTVVLTITQTRKYDELQRSEPGKKLSTKEKLKIAAPVIITSAGTLGCFYGATFLTAKQAKSLASAYALLDQNFRKYRGKVIDIYGETADKEIREAIAIHCSDYHQLNIDIPDNKVIWYDEFSGNTICRYEREIIDAEYHINRNLALGADITLNDYYEMFGFPKIDGGDDLYFSICDNYLFLDFYHDRVDNPDDGGAPMYMISTQFPPEPADYYYA